MMNMAMSESVLLEQARASDQRALRGLYDLHAGPLFRFLGQFSGDREETKEWVQRAFIKAFDRLGQFDGRSTFRTWIFTIGMNEMRSDRRRKNIVQLEQDIPTLPARARDHAEDFQWESMMKAWLDRLDNTKRSVFVLHEVEGFSHREIADMLGIQQSHSRTLLLRVRHYLQRQWKQERKAL